MMNTKFESRKYDPETDGCWVVWLDVNARWHSHAVTGGIKLATLTAQRTFLCPEVSEVWAIPAITRSQALAIAKRDWKRKVNEKALQDRGR